MTTLATSGPTVRTERTVLLRGGDLDGRRWSGVVGVGSRVAVGPAPWSASHVYVVTDEEVDDGDGGPALVAVPAAFG